MKANLPKIRKSRPADLPAIERLHAQAFGRRQEAALALALIAGKAKTFSFVAQCGEDIAGHVLVTEIGAPVKAVALAPLAVAPRFREMQVATALVNAALDAARKAGYEAAFVLGANRFYERFGFSSAQADGFKVEWQGPHFMALELVAGALQRRRGRLQYPDEFRGSDY
jgi:putative acetyltransferase